MADQNGTQRRNRLSGRSILSRKVDRLCPKIDTKSIDGLGNQIELSKETKSVDVISRLHSELPLEAIPEGPKLV